MVFDVRRAILDNDECSCYRGRESLGGLDADPGTTSSDAYRSWPPPPASGPGGRQVVCWRQCLLPGVRQGPGQVRDAAGDGSGRTTPHWAAGGALPTRWSGSAHQQTMLGRALSGRNTDRGAAPTLVTVSRS